MLSMCGRLHPMLTCLILHQVLRMQPTSVGCIHDVNHGMRWESSQSICSALMPCLTESRHGLRSDFFLCPFHTYWQYWGNVGIVRMSKSRGRPDHCPTA